MVVEAMRGDEVVGRIGRDWSWSRGARRGPSTLAGLSRVESAQASAHKRMRLFVIYKILQHGTDSIRAEHVASTEIGSVSVSGVWEFVRGGGCGGEKPRVTSDLMVLEVPSPRPGNIII